MPVAYVGRAKYLSLGTLQPTSHVQRNHPEEFSPEPLSELLQRSTLDSPESLKSVDLLRFPPRRSLNSSTRSFASPLHPISLPPTGRKPATTMGLFDSLSAAAGKATKHIAKAVNTTMETVTNTAKKVKTQVENTAVKVKNNFKVFCAKAPHILKKTFLDLRCALRIKVRHVIEWVKAHPYKTAAIIVAVILAIVLPPVILHCLGFTAAGVAAGK